MKGTSGEENEEDGEDGEELPMTTEDIVALAYVRLYTTENEVVVYRMKRESGYADLFKIGDKYCMFSVRALPFGVIDLTVGINAEQVPFDERYVGMVNQAKIGSHANLLLYPQMLETAVKDLYSDYETTQFASGMLTLVTVELEGARNDDVLEFVVESCHIPRPLGHYNVLYFHLFGILSRYYNCSKTEEGFELLVSIAKNDKQLVERRLAKIVSALGIRKNTALATCTQKFIKDFEKDATKPNGKLFVFFREDKDETYNYDEYHKEQIERTRLQATEGTSAVVDKAIVDRGGGGGGRYGHGGRHFAREGARGGRYSHGGRHFAREGARGCGGRARYGHGGRRSGGRHDGR